ncbi:homeobox-domain-containing protein, partial [Rhizophagus irregularis]
KKRTRATPEQLAILEDTFKTNTSPNSKVREALAEKVNMSERSIQIWFQNRRAKMKAMQKHQTSVSQPQPQPQQFTPPQEFITPAFNNNNNTLVSVISCETLTIGTWRRILTMSSPTDLLCY